MRKTKTPRTKSKTVRFQFAGKVLSSKVPQLVKLMADMQTKSGAFLYQERYEVLPGKRRRKGTG